MENKQNQSNAQYDSLRNWRESNFSGLAGDGEYDRTEVIINENAKKQSNANKEKDNGREL